MLRNALRALVKNLVKKSFFHNFKFKITHKQLLLYQITFTNHKSGSSFRQHGDVSNKNLPPFSQRTTGFEAG